MKMTFIKDKINYTLFNELTKNLDMIGPKSTAEAIGMLFNQVYYSRIQSDDFDGVLKSCATKRNVDKSSQPIFSHLNGFSLEFCYLF